MKHKNASYNGSMILGNKKMKKFIKKHHQDKIFLSIGISVLTLAGAAGGVVWAAASQTYADQSKTAYVTGVSKALASAGGTTKQTSGSDTKTSQTTQPQSAAAAQAQTQSATSAQQSAAAPVVAQAATLSKAMKLYVDPSRASLPAPLSTAAVATWLGGWNNDIQGATNTLVTNATNSGAVATLVAYNIPDRDCGSYSAGGAGGGDAYKAWIRGFAAGIGQRQAIVILEPDALAQVTCLDPASQSARYELLKDAVSVLASQTKASVYIDAGNPTWISATEMANRLSKAGIAGATGFSLNVSNFETTSVNTSYGNTISSKVGGKHFVIDTGRNGNGPGSTWCNPSGRALGELPSAVSNGNVDAYLWIKVPGESDGECGGGPSAGTYWSDYAQALIANRR